MIIVIIVALIVSNLKNYQFKTKRPGVKEPTGIEDDGRGLWPKEPIW